MECPICQAQAMGITCYHQADDLKHKILELEGERNHLLHKNKTLRKSNRGLKALVSKLKPYAPKQTFYDTGEGYKI